MRPFSAAAPLAATGIYTGTGSSFKLRTILKTSYQRRRVAQRAEVPPVARSRALAACFASSAPPRGRLGFFSSSLALPQRTSKLELMLRGAFVMLPRHAGIC